MNSAMTVEEAHKMQYGLGEYEGLEAGHGHGHTEHDSSAAKLERAKRFEMDVPPCLSCNVFLGTLGSLLLFVGAGWLLPGFFDASAWASVGVVACGAGLGVWFVGSSHHAHQPVRRWPLVLAACGAATGLVAVLQGATGLGLGFATLGGCLLFAALSSVLATLAFSCLVHGPWWKVYLCESYLAATSDQAMASFLWQRKAGAELEKTGLLQLRAEDASGVGGHGGHSHSHAHGGG